MPKQFRIQIGDVFDRLKVEEIFADASSGVKKCRCLCKCGGTITLRGSSLLRRNNTRSCGCLKRESATLLNTIHGESNSLTFVTWRSMIQRCHDENLKSFEKYGAVGIAVCPRWLEKGKGYINFKEDMGERPGPEYSIDRFPDNTGNYEPSNCRWATATQQARNTKRNRYLTAFGQTKLLCEWCAETGMNHKTITKRIGRGWTAEEALSVPDGHGKSYQSKES